MPVRGVLLEGRQAQAAGEARWVTPGGCAATLLVSVLPLSAWLLVAFKCGCDYYG